MVTVDDTTKRRRDHVVTTDSDVVAIVAPIEMMSEMEVRTEIGVQQDDQRRWRPGVAAMHRDSSTSGMATTESDQGVRRDAAVRVYHPLVTAKEV